MWIFKHHNSKMMSHCQDLVTIGHIKFNDLDIWLRLYVEMLWYQHLVTLRYCFIDYTEYHLWPQSLTVHHMWPDFGKPTKLSQIVFRVLTILSIEATMILSC